MRILARGFAGSVLLLVGGLLSSRMPPSSWLAQLDVLVDVRSIPATRDAGLLALFGGLALLTWAWIALGRQVRSRADGIATVNVAAAWWALPLLAAPPLFSSDAWSYAAEGYLAGHGLSPYVITPSMIHGPIVDAVSARWLQTPTPYGPLPLDWGGLVSHLTADPWQLMLAYRGLALAGLAMLAYAVPRLARHAGHDPATASWMVVASPFVLAHGVGGLHNDLVMTGLIAVALLAAIERGWVLGAVIVGAAAAVKIPGLFGVVGVVLLSLPPGADLVRRLSRSVCVGAVALGTVAALGLVGGLGFGWVRALAVPVALHTPLSISSEIGTHLHARSAVLAVALLLLAAGGLVVLLRTPTGDRPAGLRSAAVVLLLGTVLSPVVHYWYWLWCLPVLACCRLPDRAASSVLGVTVALGLVAPLDPALRIPGTTTLSVGAVLLALAVAQRPVRPSDRTAAV